MVKQRQKNGFSIIEVLIAIFIIVFGLMGVLTVVQQNVQVSRVNRQSIISANLAQEGLELIRMLRDENWIKGNAFDAGLTIGTSTIDYNGYSQLAASGILHANAILKINADGLYAHQGVTDTPYSRVINIVKLNADTLLVTCQVRYRPGILNSDYIATEILTDWQM